MPDRKPIPTAGFVAVVLVLASEVVFLARTEPLTGWPLFELTADDAVLVGKEQLLDRSAGRVVLVGDSSCMMGLVPAEIRQEVGPALNLGTMIDMTPAGFSVMAGEALEREPPPRMVVLAVLPHAFEATEARAAERDQLGRYLIAYHRTSPLYHPGAADVRSWFYRKHRVNVFPPEMGGSFSAFAAALSESDGYYPERSKYTGARTVRDDFTPTPFAREAVRLLVKSAKARGVPVVLWLNPSPVDAVTSEYASKVDAFLEQLRREEPDLRVPQTRTPVRGVGSFGTVTHLTPEAAKLQSQELGRVLKSIRGP